MGLGKDQLLAVKVSLKGQEQGGAPQVWKFAEKARVRWKPGTIAEGNAMGGLLPHPLASSAFLGSTMAPTGKLVSDPPARTSSALVGPGVLAAANLKASPGISPGLPCLRVHQCRLGLCAQVGRADSRRGPLLAVGMGQRTGFGDSIARNAPEETLSA